MKCSICKLPGHNKRTCKNRIEPVRTELLSWKRTLLQRLNKTINEMGPRNLRIVLEFVEYRKHLKTLI